MCFHKFDAVVGAGAKFICCIEATEVFIAPVSVQLLLSF